ncbi:TIM barrel protein [Rothia sp. ZJ932]|uniref:TIM barrel protein n=1 Tax=Rothia sp. ZJ932 TaxID=2810516 RepID=UPI001966FD6F|nr:TIM barrel protein [Rothia sp. ZJ932]QRZ61479.1 TIM barrel protein [Rothia sp. ZJ932]
MARIASAPISWGVCEVPGWGHQMQPERVLAEMKELGFEATEFGPEGFLPDAPADKAAVLKDNNMVAVGGFVPVVLHDAEVAPLPTIEKELEGFVAAGGKTLVLAAATGIDGYDADRPVLDEAGWATVYTNIDRILEAAQKVGVSVALHPHAGTMVENKDDVNHILSGSSVNICFDTGHMFIGGIDPVQFAVDHADRISHVHLKDVKLEFARRVQAGEQTYYDAVVEGMYRPLGQGDIDIAKIVSSLEKAGFDGWYVLEQDNVIHEEPTAGEGPIADARVSLDYLKGLISA